MKKTAIIKTSFTIVTHEEKQTIEIEGSDFWNVSVEFSRVENQMSLDENGEIFDLGYELKLKAEQNAELLLISSNTAKELGKKIKEVEILFEFIEKNKENLFEELGIDGVLL